MKNILTKLHIGEKTIIAAEDYASDAINAFLNLNIVEAKKQLKLAGLTVKDLKFLDYDSDNLELTGHFNGTFKGKRKWKTLDDESLTTPVFGFEEKKIIIYVEKENPIFWIYIQYPLKQIKQDFSDDKINDWKLERYLKEAFDKSKHEFKVKVAEGVDTEYDEIVEWEDRLDYIVTRYKVFNKKYFYGKLPAIPIRLQKNTKNYRRLGAYFTGSKRCLSFHPALFDKDKSKLIDETLVHEMCHQAQYELSPSPGSGHGKIWQQWMILCGQNPNRTADVDSDDYLSEEELKKKGKKIDWKRSDGITPAKFYNKGKAIHGLIVGEKKLKLVFMHSIKEDSTYSLPPDRFYEPDKDQLKELLSEPWQLTALMFEKRYK